MRKQAKKLSGMFYGIIFCLTAVAALYTGCLWCCEEEFPSGYLAGLAFCIPLGLLLGYALWNLSAGREKAAGAVIALFAAYLGIRWGYTGKISEFWMAALLFWPLAAAGCLAAVMLKKGRSGKRIYLTVLLLSLAVSCVVMVAGEWNPWIIPFWLVQAMLVLLYLVPTAGDDRKRERRMRTLWIAVCLLLTLVFCEVYPWVRAAGKILFLLWPAAAYGAFRMTDQARKKKGTFPALWTAAFFCLIFAGMWLLREPQKEMTGYKWEPVRACYLLLTADLIFLLELRGKRCNGGGKKPWAQYSVMALANAGYLCFFVRSSQRFRQILYSLGMKAAKGSMPMERVSWGGLRMAALRANLTGNPDAVQTLQKCSFYREWEAAPLSMMNLYAGAWLPVLVLALSCLLLYFMRKLPYRDKSAERVKSCLCIAWGIRIVIAVLTNLFWITASEVGFPLLGGNGADLAVAVIILLPHVFEGSGVE